MKAAPSSLIALALSAALLVLNMAFSALTFNAAKPTPFSSIPTFTCATNTSAIIDSFGNSCLNITSYVRRQLIYAYQSPHLSYLYCGIPKNGCTYHIGIIHRLMGYSYEGGFNVHNLQNKQRVRAGHEINQMLLHHIRRYAVVRNPIHRVLSAYLNKVEKSYTDQSLKTPNTFREWVYQNLHPGMSWKGVNVHWRSQVEFCGFKIRDLASYFTLFRVENPEEYVAYLEGFLPDRVLKDGWDMPLNKSFREHVLGPRTRTENTTERFFDYIGNVGTFDYLRQVYDDDITAFGYEEEVDELRRILVKRVSEKR